MRNILLLLILVPVISFGQESIKSDCICKDSIVLQKNKDGIYLIEDLPIYPGGKEAFINYLKANISLTNSINGKIEISFVINCTGIACGFEVEEKEGNLTNKSENSIIEILKRMENWEPGKQRGREVDCPYGISIEIINGKMI